MKHSGSLSVRCKIFPRAKRRGFVASLCLLSVVCIAVVSVSRPKLTTEGQILQSLRRGFLMPGTSPQGPDLDYSNFKHTSQRHASLACTACHERAGDNSATP